MGARHSRCVVDESGEVVRFRATRFARGEYKNAFEGVGRDHRKVVVKAYRKVWQARAAFEVDQEMHHLASELAKRFSSQASIQDKKPIQVLVPQVGVVRDSACFSATAVNERVTVEPFLEGKYRKFVSNNGTVHDPTGVLSALCHWTYHVSKGKLMLVDIQGVYSKTDGFVITDPAFHSEDGARFGELDLGVQGMQAFFAHHRCNHICARFRKPAGGGATWADCEATMRRRLANGRVAPAASTGTRHR